MKADESGRGGRYYANPKSPRGSSAIKAEKAIRWILDHSQDASRVSGDFTYDEMCKAFDMGMVEQCAYDNSPQSPIMKRVLEIIDERLGELKALEKISLRDIDLYKVAVSELESIKAKIKEEFENG